MSRRDRNNNPNPKKKRKPNLDRKVASPPIVTCVDDIPQDFIDIWLQCPGFNPIIEKSVGKGWWTIKSKSGKPVPLTEQHIRKAYLGQTTPIGKRCGSTTNFLMIDIDRYSIYHPLINGLDAWAPILEAMEDIGLCRYFIVQSTRSGGYHICFPLPEPVKSLVLAKHAYKALKVHKVTIESGTCELSPNRKNFGRDFQGIRLPLQRKDSYVVDDNLNFVTQDFAEFVSIWKLAAAGQSLDLNTQITCTETKLPEIEFTGPGQTNEILRQLANYGDRYLGLRTVKSLGDWMKETVSRLPGYEEYVSPESEEDINKNMESNGWTYRWAKSHINSQRFDKIKQKATQLGYHHAKSEEAINRLMEVLEALGTDIETGIISTLTSLNELRKMILKKGKELYGCGFGTPFLSKNKNLWSWVLAAFTEDPSNNHTTLHPEAAVAAPRHAPHVTNGKVEDRLEIHLVEGDPQPDVGVAGQHISLDDQQMIADCRELTEENELVVEIEAEYIELSDHQIKASTIPKNHWLRALSGLRHRIRRYEVEAAVWRKLHDSVEVIT